MLYFFFLPVYREQLNPHTSVSVKNNPFDQSPFSWIDALLFPLERKKVTKQTTVCPNGSTFLAFDRIVKGQGRLSTSRPRCITWSPRESVVGLRGCLSTATIDNEDDGLIQRPLRFQLRGLKTMRNLSFYCAMQLDEACEQPWIKSTRCAELISLGFLQSVLQICLFELPSESVLHWEWNSWKIPLCGRSNHSDNGGIVLPHTKNEVVTRPGKKTGKQKLGENKKWRTQNRME